MAGLALPIYCGMSVHRAIPAEASPRAGSLDKMGMHAQDTAEIVFDGVPVPATMVLGEIGGGFEALTRHLPSGVLSRVDAANAKWWATEMQDACSDRHRRESFR